MEKRKAFTLIELMGVLVIIGILTVILVPVINNTIKNNKQQLYDNQLEMIRLAARNLATDNTYILPEEDGDEIYITLGQLRAMGYAEGTIIDPLTNENFSDNLIVMIIKKGNDYDYVIIDCPPSLGLVTLNAFTASDSVLIPIQCEYYALEGLSQLIHTIELVQERLNPELEIEGVVFTMYDARTNLSNQVVKEVKKYFEDKVYKTVIPRNVRLSEAPSYGMPITEYDPRSKGAKSYMKFAKEFLKINDEQKKAKHMM